MKEMLKRILHLLPFVHFYTKWSDPLPNLYGGYERQERVCTVCNRKQCRLVDNV